MTTNKKMSETYNRSLHHYWAKGFELKKGRAKQFHPYTRKDFQFDYNKNLLENEIL